MENNNNSLHPDENEPLNSEGTQKNNIAKFAPFICIFLGVAILGTLLIVYFKKGDVDSPLVSDTTLKKQTEAVSESTTATPSTEAEETLTETETYEQPAEVPNDDEMPFQNPEIITIDPNNKYMTLVNTNYRIPSDYEPDLKYVCNSDERLDVTVAKAYEEMYNAAAKENVYLTPCSGYRSYELQERNYNNLAAAYEKNGYTTREAYLNAAREIMPPGSSEHNLGFAMDIVCIEEWFEDTDEFKWLQEHAHEYGFIMRYAKEKESITGVIYEPWHWRYVGVENAEKIKNSGKCLEEYLGKY